MRSEVRRLQEAYDKASGSLATLQQEHAEVRKQSYQSIFFIFIPF
jgi:hypothetical protein